MRVRHSPAVSGYHRAPGFGSHGYYFHTADIIRNGDGCGSHETRRKYTNYAWLGNPAQASGLTIRGVAGSESERHPTYIQAMRIYLNNNKFKIMSLKM